MPVTFFILWSLGIAVAFALAPAVYIIPWALGIAVTFLLSRAISRATPASASPLLYPGWPAAWTTTATLFTINLLAKNCTALTDLYLMAGLFFWFPVAFTVLIAVLHEAGQALHRLYNRRHLRPAPLSAA